MNRSFHLVPAAAGLAFALTACGGQNTAGSLPAAVSQPQALPAGSVRHTSSTCTPDSYGYCLTTNSTTLGPMMVCNDNGAIVHYRNSSSTHTLYHYGQADGNYTLTTSGNPCLGSQESYWTPDDPQADTGDPNLP